jgi:hypothetical protein
MESQKTVSCQTTVILSFPIQWTENISGEVTEDFINRMSNDEFSFFIKCKLPEKYLRTMRDNLLYIGDEKRMMLLKQITLCKSLGRI